MSEVRRRLVVTIRDHLPIGDGDAVAICDHIVEFEDCSRKLGEPPLRSQNVILKGGRHTKYRPYAFTEHGALMAASILNTPRGNGCNGRLEATT
jgi:hypothetical protein